MPKVTATVARIDSPKACPSAKAGQTYYWWRTRMKGARSGTTRCSLSRPRPSQLTSSEFWGEAFSLQETMEDAVGTVDDVSDLESLQQEWADAARALGDQQRDKRSNMPEGLQDGDTGQMLEERADGCDGWADEILAVAIPDPEDFADEEDPADALKDAIDEAIGEISNLQPECA